MLGVKRVFGHDLLEELDIALKTTRAPVQPTFTGADFDARHVLSQGGNRKQRNNKRDPEIDGVFHGLPFHDEVP
ncbi:MAG TPA: hypothetical protein VKP67_23160 [Xanthobacteraceae bacterium]|nr:hypothetical protein [Xanthobacteraceae bacterium]